MESTYRQIWRIAWPVMAASLAQNAVSLIDTFFLGLLGAVELAAGGIGVVVFLTIGFIGLGLGTGVQVLTAHSLGENQPHQLGAILRQSLWISAAIGAFLTLAVALGIEPLLALILHDPAVRAPTVLFLKGRSLELFPLILFGALRGFYSGTAQTTYILQANLLLSGTNLLLNAIFVLGLGWGLYGVVAGSVLAQYVATFYLFVGLRSQKYDLTAVSFQKWIGPLFRYAGPSILQNLVGMTGWLIFFLVIERRGPMALAAANVVRSLYSFCMLPAWAFSTAAGTLVAYFWAARAYQELWRVFRRTWFLSQGLNVVLALLLVLFSSFGVKIFTEDVSLQMQAQKDLYIVAVSLGFMPLSAILISAVVAVDQVLAAFVTEVGIIALYVCYVFFLDRAKVSLTWLWTAEWVYWVPSAIVLGLIFYRRVRKAYRLSLSVPNLS
ncbi:MAG: MATE family efflux transporter [Bacteroidia bacterium]|jgi:putative MATE family efflux protein|nr:MATE family efflux transporter [Bacteroidia bacterium]GIV22668.1 MAG: MATE family efflux transporter [Bacteroidia bacterium]